MKKRFRFPGMMIMIIIMFIYLMNEWMDLSGVCDLKDFFELEIFFLILITLNVNYLKILLAKWFLHLLLFNVCVVVVCCRCSHFSLLRFLITIMMRRCDMFIIMMIIRLINLFFSAKSRNFFFSLKQNSCITRIQFSF